MEAEIVEKADGFWDPREKLELGARERSIDDARFMVINEGVDDAVAIEEYGFHG